MAMFVETQDAPCALPSAKRRTPAMMLYIEQERTCTDTLTMVESTTLARPPHLLRHGKGDIDTPIGSAMTRDTPRSP